MGASCGTSTSLCCKICLSFKNLKLSPWGLDRSAMKFSTQNAAHTWSQTSVWTSLAQSSNRGGGPLPISFGCLDLGVILQKNDHSLYLYRKSQCWHMVGARLAQGLAQATSGMIQLHNGFGQRPCVCNAVSLARCSKGQPASLYTLCALITRLCKTCGYVLYRLSFHEL